jgi:hypothetical protein
MLLHELLLPMQLHLQRLHVCTAGNSTGSFMQDQPASKGRGVQMQWAAIGNSSILL